ncbi:MAG: peroxisome assembly protein (Peroxin-2) [Vezdaea aestivalis]|nr:MAG: peroxisome assembly protein (Peroxin-2) [Vezdaea aestivalis]
MASTTFFQEAQQRLTARRLQRETAERLRQAEQLRSQSSSALPFPLDRISIAGRRTLEKLDGRNSTQPAFRVGQIDAELLDEELLEILRAQVGDALKYYGSHIRNDWAAEITLTLRAILFKLSIWDNNSTYGASLQNLHFVDARKSTLAPVAPSRWQKGLYGLVTVGGTYAWQKWEEWQIGQEHSLPHDSRLSRLSSAFTGAYSAASLLSFLVFLLNGRYRTLLDRILRMRLAPKTSQIAREVSFEYLNRQLVWHSFTEFLLFVLPLVGISRWRRWVARAWRKAKSMVFRGKNTDSVEKGIGELHFLPERTCAICYQEQNPAATSEVELLQTSGSGGVVGSAETDVTNPYETIPCGCIYCFVCIVQQLEAQEGYGWTCLRCGENVKKCKPWNGDVVEETAESVKKVVGFVEGDDSLTEVEPRPEEDTQGDSTAVDDDDDEEADLEARHEEDIDVWTKSKEIRAPHSVDMALSPASEDGHG